jgi:hypothetical protein
MVASEDGIEPRARQRWQIYTTSLHLPCQTSPVRWLMPDERAGKQSRHQTSQCDTGPADGASSMAPAALIRGWVIWARTR